MKIAYYNYAGRPARLILDDEDIPERCELFDKETESFVVRDDQTADIWFGHDAYLISKDDFDALVAKHCKSSRERE